MKRNVVVVFVVDPSEYTRPTEADIAHHDPNHYLAGDVDRNGVETSYYEDTDQDARVIVVEALRGNAETPNFVIPTDLIYTGDPTVPKPVLVPPPPIPI